MKLSKGQKVYTNWRLITSSTMFRDEQSRLNSPCSERHR